MYLINECRTGFVSYTRKEKKEVKLFVKQKCCIMGLELRLWHCFLSLSPSLSFSVSLSPFLSLSLCVSFISLLSLYLSSHSLLTLHFSLSASLSFCLFPFLSIYFSSFFPSLGISLLSLSLSLSFCVSHCFSLQFIMDQTHNYIPCISILFLLASHRE